MFKGFFDALDTRKHPWLLVVIALPGVGSIIGEGWPVLDHRPVMIAYFLGAVVAHVAYQKP